MIWLTISTVKFVEEIVPFYAKMGLQQLSVVEVRGCYILGVPDDVDYLDLLLPDLGRQKLAWQVRLDQAGKTSRKPTYYLVHSRHLARGNDEGRKLIGKFYLDPTTNSTLQ